MIMATKVIILSKKAEDGAEAFQEYLEGVTPLFAAASLNVNFRGAFSDGLAGSDFPENVLLLDFGSKEAAQEFFGSEAYQALVPVRDRAFSSLKIFFADEF
jgi:uncharacterized protein (DUF1330 family)